MKHYMISDGVLVEDPRGGFVEWDDIVGELLSKATKQTEAISEALKEIRELRQELRQTTKEGRDSLERDWDGDQDGF